MKHASMQGPPGSGKSTRALKIAREHGAIICSTDSYFYTRDGRYLFDLALLSAHHQRNTRRALALLDEGFSVVVDNTNIQRWACREVG
jgi:predicted kinase